MRKTARQHRGQRAYHAGRAAEDSIALRYERAGCPIAARRWRGSGGEIDLIAQDGETVVFIEVKQARSRDAALSRVTPQQVRRIYATAEEYCGTQPKGSLTDVRFDVAVVDGSGVSHVIENAFV